ncbi:patatin-like phospholipase family protein [Pararhizobium sp. YC-54]|uniref:patatin-like phospholipase family protein n=1 Tax=Pararhizobium sp. YC-54 TaxID=2986920 RepID=UPI0021F7F56E|nr:patatin-like phospholipase family protein [Pararhizobium sp. YC-54]MCW0000562.1 patatin-like phospholipase family protein [Pararhizobium sp. YC-54]
MSIPTEKTVLVFQGGGALGAYQAGAYEALHEAGVRPDWLAGISIGSINSAIIAGSPVDQRVDNLRTFWHRVSSGLPGHFHGNGNAMRKWFNNTSAFLGSLTGVPGFFTPRVFAPWKIPGDPMAAISLYDTAPLEETLAGLVDFDLINSGAIRLSLGAVDVMSGNFNYFDNNHCAFSVKHVAASGALPPGFAPVEIDGRFYWDGGIVSNTPLQRVLSGQELETDLCIFQVDLFSAKGPLPRDLFDVEAREKEIRFSSRTRLNTDQFRKLQSVRMAAKRLMEKLPPELKDDPDARLLERIGNDCAVTMVHLIYRHAAYESGSKDYEFSRLSVEEHWKAGHDDVVETLSHPDWLNRTRPTNGIRVFDLAEQRLRGNKP